MDQGCTFEEFILQCARAFGACIGTRDDPTDAPIPDKFEASDYHVKALKREKAEHTRLLNMAKPQQAAFGEAARASGVESSKKFSKNQEEANNRLESMEARVREWEPPTHEHYGLKKFMLEQIEISKHDLGGSRRDLKRLEEQAPLEYWREAVGSSARSIAYHTEEMFKDGDRAKKRTEWVKQLRDSLKK